jgi:very-short-patch-repair endonuclease
VSCRASRLLHRIGVKGDWPDRRVAVVAGRQYGVIGAAQLSAAGVSRGAVLRRVESGRLHRLHQGVYAVGHPGVSREGRWLAAVLASGPGAVLSHGGAAVHWGLLRQLSGPVDVSVPTQAGRRARTGIRLHRRAALGADEVTRHLAIPVTTPSRTVADLAGSVAPRLARRARRQAEMLGLPLGDEIQSDRTRSDLEQDFLDLCRRKALPTPEVNVRIGNWTVDFAWPERRLVVETDSYLYHRGKVAFEDDRERDLAMRALGYDVIRLSERHLTGDRERIARQLSELLGRAVGDLTRHPAS